MKKDIGIIIIVCCSLLIIYMLISTNTDQIKKEQQSQKILDNNMLIAVECMDNGASETQITIDADGNIMFLPCEQTN